MIQDLNISDNLCTICMQEFNGNEIKCLSCYNKFHIECINRWCKEGSNKLCPLCKDNQICLTLLKKKRHMLRVKHAQQQGERLILERLHPQHKDILKIYNELTSIERQIDEIDTQIYRLELENRREHNTFLPISGGKRKLLRYKYKKHLGGSDNFEDIRNSNFSDTQSDFYSDPLDNSSHSIRRATHDLRNQDMKVVLDLMRKLKFKKEKKEKREKVRLSRKLMDRLYYYRGIHYREPQRLDSTTNIELEESEDEYSLYNDIKALLNEGANPNYIDEYDTTPLIVAAKNNWYNIVNLLLKSGANIEMEISVKGNALMQAVVEGHYDIVLLLIERGANINLAQKMSNMTALHWAVVKSRENIVELLLKNGANPDLRAKPWGNLNTSEGQTPFELAIFIHVQANRLENSEALALRAKMMKTVNVFQRYYARKTADKAWVAIIGQKRNLPTNISGEYGTDVKAKDFKDGEIQTFLGGMKPEDLTPEKLEELASYLSSNSENYLYEYLDIFDRNHPRFYCKSVKSKVDELEKWMIHTLFTLQGTFPSASFYIGGRVIPNTPPRRDIHFSNEDNVNEKKLETEEDIKEFTKFLKTQSRNEILKFFKMFLLTHPKEYNHTGSERYLFIDEIPVQYKYYLFESPNICFNRKDSDNYRFGIGGLVSLVSIMSYSERAQEYDINRQMESVEELKLNIKAFQKKIIRICSYSAVEKSRQRFLKKQEDNNDDSDDSEYYVDSLNSLFDNKLSF